MKYSLMASACAASILASGAVSAEAAEPADASAGSKAVPFIEEVVVTAQKRLQNAQDIPVAINAIGEDQIKASGAVDTLDLKALVPSLNVTTGVAGFGLPRIRGIGASGQGPGIENPVAVLVDDVYYGAPFGVLQSLFDTKQVAVLKGPQGTLFGRNATGGVIQISTLDPEFDWQGKLQAGYGNYDSYNASAFLTGGLSDKIAVSFAGQYDSRNKGYGVNRYTGNDVQEGDSWSGRGKIKWVPDDDTFVLLSADFSGRNASDPAFRNFTLNSSGENLEDLITAAGGDPANDIYSDLDPLLRARQSGVSLKVSHDFDGMEIKSITAYRNTKLQTLFDPDGTIRPLLRIDNHNFDKQFTQEIDLVSRNDGPLTWTIGGFYMWNSAGQEPGRTTGLITFGDNGYSDSITDVRLNSLSGFAEGSYAVSDATNLTAGIRYTHDEREFEAYEVEYNGNINVTTVGETVGDSRTFNKVTWRLALDHRFSDQVLGYVSYNRGFRSGTYVPQATPIIALEPEVVDAYEIGLKTDFLDRKVRFNVAAYYYDQTNVQVQQVIAGVNSIYNAQGAETYGIDADFIVQATDNLRLFGGLGYVHARYTDFEDAIISVPYPLPAGFVIPTGQSCRGTFGNPYTQVGGNCLITGDATGNKLQNTPAITANIGASYDIYTDFGRFTLMGNYYYNDGYVGTADERVVQDSYSLLDASMTWHSESEAWYIRLWGRNLTNAHYFAQIGATNSGDNGTPAAPRTYGLTLGVEF
ncbi:MAG: TonB-dependent receptor [Alphaproteobacteria bacterium]|nr:MAG: TonB-dependent receptor [Alphaproteobacteria bacterium]